MSKSIDIILTANDWYSEGGVSVRGYCYKSDGTLLRDKALAEHFATATDEESFAKLLRRDCNGLFAVVIDTPSFKALAVDNSRIYPLFYSAKGAVSDSAYALAGKCRSLNSHALTFYNAAGMTPERETLLCEVRQVAAASYVVLCDCGVCRVKYYSYLVDKGRCRLKGLTELDGVMNAAFKRAFDSVGGRQIIVPLSGGYDSRLVVCMLKRLGYANVVCFTVGNDKSYEVRIASEVCRTLGFKHLVIDAGAAVSEGLNLADEHFKGYCRHMGNFVNFSYVFEYVALKRLKELNVVEPDAVFVPGHSGDFYGGGYVLKSGVTERSTPKQITKAILYDIIEYNFTRGMREIVSNMVAPQHEPHSVVQEFVKSHTLAMCINNSARVYGYFGHEVRLPFWDMEVLNFFRDIHPLQLTSDRIYYLYTHNIFEQLKVDLRQPQPTLIQMKTQRIKNRIKKHLPKCIAALLTRHNNLTDELTLCKPMLKQMSRRTCHYSVNDIMKQWYLSEVQRFITETPVQECR